MARASPTSSLWISTTSREVQARRKLGRSVLALFEADGHETSSVHLQRLDRAPDERVFSVCLSEERALVTLDLDFANPRGADSLKR